MRVTLVTIASACHRVNRAYCLAHGDDSQPEWDQAPQWQRESAIKGVALHITDPNMTPAASHNAWLEQKTRDGWSYGPKKDPENRKHPCFLPYDELPAEQKAKDYLFKAVVESFRTLLPGGTIAEAADIAQRFQAPQDDAVMATPPPESIVQPGTPGQNAALMAALDDGAATKSADELEAQASAEHEAQAQAHADAVQDAADEQHAATSDSDAAPKAKETKTERKAREKAEREAAKNSAQTDPKTPSVENQGDPA